MDENVYVLLHPDERDVEACVRDTGSGQQRGFRKANETQGRPEAGAGYQALPGTCLETPIRREVGLTRWEAEVSRRGQGSRPQMLRGESFVLAPSMLV